MSHRAISAATPPRMEGAPIDLDHLRSQTCGDAALEADLLDLFSRQARMILGALATAPASATSRREADLLHTLCGSARAVGAWEVANGAEQLERMTREAATDEATPALPSRPADLRAALDGSVERACRAIDDLRGTAPGPHHGQDPTRR